MQVNAHDEDDIESPTEPLPRQTQPIPNSPPPSFHSRASSIISRERDTRVNPDLADAFDDSDDESDDGADDTQRLVRSSGTSASTGGESTRFTVFESAPGPIPMRRPLPAQQTMLEAAGNAATGNTARAGSAGQSPLRVFGGGIQSDGVFSNLTAKPEAGDGEKEEMPPVCLD